jgi:hypothetical protein
MYFMRFLFFLGLMAMAWSCKKDPGTLLNGPANTGYTTTNDVKINVTNVVDNSVLQLSPGVPYTSLMARYVNAHGDTFTVSKFKYFISNIKLRRPDGTYYIEPESYRIVDASDSLGTCKFAIRNVPMGNYISVEFMIGVDSARNTSGAQTGDLAQTDDMYWSWNQGYIFLKLEGYSYSAPPSALYNLLYHVGGFFHPYYNIKTVSLPFTQNALIVDADHVSKVYLKANVQEFFRSSTIIDVSTMPIVTSPSAARVLAINYSHMFSVAAVVH